MRHPTDYESFQEILNDLMKPIASDGIAIETLVNLYESKLAYLENLRVKCFREMNSPKNALTTKAQHEKKFEEQDYQLILATIDVTRRTLKYTMITSIVDSFKKVNSAR